MVAGRIGKRKKTAIDISDFGIALNYARESFRRNNYSDAFDTYELLVQAYPRAAIALLAEVYDCYKLLPGQDRYNLYVSRLCEFGITSSDKVLDIGSGHLPFPLATHFADISTSDNQYGRAGEPFKYIEGKPVYECNVETMPFKDKEFDFVYCSHVLEHVVSPENACCELMRIGKRGFIEAPTRGKDLFLNTAKTSNHRWAVEYAHNTLIFTEYTGEEIEGFQCDILMQMNTNPETPREKAFSALLCLKAAHTDTMLLWENTFRYEVHRLPKENNNEIAPLQIQNENYPHKSNHSCLFLNTYYQVFLDQYYKNNAHLASASYGTQITSLQSQLFGDSDFYSTALKKTGWQADDLIINCEFLQEAWRRENGFSGKGLEIVIEQVRRLKPQVIYIQDLSIATKHFLSAIRPHTELMVGQIATSVPYSASLFDFDIIFSSFPHFVEQFRKAGITAYYQPLAFDPRTSDRLSPISKNTVRKYPVTFVGGISPRQHIMGTDFLEQVAKRISIDFWGYGAQHLPAHSSLRKQHRGEAWGRDMCSILYQSYITINRHGEVSENYANNMRLFEATGCGALLITDYKDNLHELFEIGKEIVAYRSPAECVALIKYYLANPEEGKEIAKAGQKRTLSEHTYTKRMEKTAEILERHLRYRREKNRFPSPDLAKISYGYENINKSDVTEKQTEAWKSEEIPAKQRALVQQELANMYKGKEVAPFKVLADILRPHIFHNCSVLEIGCASGYYYEILEYLLNTRIDYTGVDYSEHLVSMASDYYPRAKFFAADAANLFFADKQFYTVISSCVLLHVPNYRQHIFETARVAQNLVVAHRTPICRQRPTQCFKKLAYGVEVVEIIFNEAEILREFDVNGLKLVNTIEYYTNPHHDEFQVTYLFKRI